MVATFASFDAALAANDKWTQRVVLIDGKPTVCTDVSTRHGTGSPIASAQLMLPAPAPSHVQPGATVEVQAGYRGITATIFSGYIPTAESVLDTGGGWVTVTATGWLALTVDPPRRAARWRGPIQLREIVRSILRERKVPYTLIDDITDDEGDPILFGTNEAVNEGIVEIGTTTGFFSWLTQTLSLFGYEIFDNPDGTVRVTRISGIPDRAPVMTVRQGGRPSLSFGKRWTTDGMITYPDVRGATYTDEDGAQQQIRSFPATVVINPILRPLGYRKGDRSSNALDTNALADLARHHIERTSGDLITTVQWSTELAPHIGVGDVVRVRSSAIGADEDVWVTSIAHTYSAEALKKTTFEGQRGTGVARPAGIDTKEYVLRRSPVHLGDEVIPWYAVPQPSGASIQIPFTVPETYFSLKIVALAHGCNSYLLDGENTEASVSKIVLYQNGEQISSGTLQSLDEDYAAQLPYGYSDTHWSRIAVPLSGSLSPGRAVLEIVAGEDSKATGGPIDDFEIKDIVLVASGVGEPVYVRED